MIAFQIVLIGIGLYTLYLYIGPLISLGVLNAGNIFGFIVSALFTFSGIFFKQICQKIQDLLDTGWGKIVVATGAIVLISFYSVFVVSLHQVVQHAEYTATNESTVIVLGCQIRGSEPSMTLKSRAKVAADYLNEHPKAVAIATGGQGKDEDLSEGQCIYNLMTEYGVSPKRIIIEDQSKNTDQNIANAKKIIDERGLSTDVAVATSEYHQYRASIICKKNGLNASSIPSHSSRRAKPTFYSREIFAIWEQRLKGNS